MKKAIWQAMESYQFSRDKSGKFSRPYESKGREGKDRITRATEIVGLGVQSLSHAKQIVDSRDEDLIDTALCSFCSRRGKDRFTKLGTFAYLCNYHFKVFGKKWKE